MRFIKWNTISLICIISAFIFLPNISHAIPEETATITPTLTATPSPTVTPTITPTVDVPLIDNFDNDGQYWDQSNVRDALWWGSGNGIYELGHNNYQPLAGNTTWYLQINYNKTAGEEWSFIAMQHLAEPGNRTNYSNENQLSMHVYGTVKLMFKFEDVDGHASADSGVITVNSPQTWENVTWDYAGLAWNNCDSSHIKNILIFVQPGETGTGTFYLDNITLGPGSVPSTPVPTATATIVRTPTPGDLMIDNFDNDANYTDESLARDAAWNKYIYVNQISMATNLDGNQTPFLKVVYEKGTEPPALIKAENLHALDNRMDYSGEHELSLWVYGTVDLSFRFVDTDFHDTEISPVSHVVSPGHWSNITWDYSGLDWRYCDPTRVSKIEIHIQSTGGGYGEFYLDNLTLGPGSTPPNSTPTPVVTATVTSTISLTPTITPTSTEVPTLTPTPSVPWVDNFDNDASYADAADQRDARWWASGQGIYSLQMQNDLGGNTTPFLHITYNKPAGEEWSFVRLMNLSLPGNQCDYSTVNELSMRIYGTVKLLFKFMDGDKSTTDSPVFEVNSPGAWTNVTWNYSGINWGYCDPQQIDEIYIFVLPGETGSGEFYIDDVTLGPAMAPPGATPTVTWTSTPIGMPTEGLVDNFDNDGSYVDEINKQDAFWRKSNDNLFGFEMATNIAGNSTPSMKVTYNKPAGEEWAFIYAGELYHHGNNGDFSGAHELSMHIYGTVKLLLKYEDASSRPSADSGIIEVNSPGAWTNVTWDYTGLDWNTCDPHYIKNILVFILPGETGSGEFYIDNVYKGPGVTPPVSGSSIRSKVTYNKIKIDCPWHKTKTPTPTAKGTLTPTSTATLTSTITSTPTAQKPSATKTTTPTCTVTKTPQVAALPEKVLAYPNPAKDKAVFAWKAKNVEAVRIEIYSMSGERVAVLKESAPGSGHVVWNTNHIAPGIYLYRMILTIDGKDQIQESKKIAIVK